MMFRRLFVVFGVIAIVVSPSFAEGLDIDLTAPTLTILGTTISGTVWDDILLEFETQIEGDPDIQNYTTPTDIARGFANAGAASTHLATQRSFSDYRAFALVVGTGVALSAPTVDPSAIESVADDFSDEGDIYFGAAVQPITVSFGVNLSRWIDRLRVNAKFGYFNLPYGTIADEVSFRSMTIGVGADYQIVETRSVLAGVLRWRGVSLGSGLNYQTNTTAIELTIEDDSLSIPVTKTDLGVTVPGAPETLGDLVLSPGVEAEILSSSWSIPLEVSTGLRVLYILDVNVGAGIDLAIGRSELSLGAGSEIDFEPAAGVNESQVSVDPGSADLGISEESNPQFVRPRLTAGIGLNMGPVKLDVPMMYYLDLDGPTAMVGVNLGIVW
jgi:hypothetical protein